jgi:hypothetical protein
MHLCAQTGLFRRIRKGGAWSEKLVTLTVPHFVELGVLERVHFLRAAWKHFVRRWSKHWKKHEDAKRWCDDDGRSLVRWFRNVEWTTGEEDDAKGHPHIHLWFLGPYLPGAKASERLEGRNLIKNLWGDALAAAAADVDVLTMGSGDRVLIAHVARACASPVVDVRRCDPGPSSAKEVIKYLFKDLNASGHRLDPQLWAKVFEAFDGTRTTQGSRGLATLGRGCYVVDPKTGEITGKSLAVQCACGQRGYWRAHRRPVTPEEQQALEAARRARLAEGLAKTKGASHGLFAGHA